MKILILILTFLSFSMAQQYVFLVNKYDQEIELEAKIITQIATDSVKEKIKLFIPNISKLEEKIYYKHVQITYDCNVSNFVFDKGDFNNNQCKNKKRLYFTNNYRKLIGNNQYYGAFFWSKSRPNIVFIKDRLLKNSIELAQSYKQFIEDFDNE